MFFLAIWKPCRCAFLSWSNLMTQNIAINHYDHIPHISNSPWSLLQSVMRNWKLFVVICAKVYRHIILSVYVHVCLQKLNWVHIHMYEKQQWQNIQNDIWKEVRELTLVENIVLVFDSSRGNNYNGDCLEFDVNPNQQSSTCMHAYSGHKLCKRIILTRGRPFDLL